MAQEQTSDLGARIEQGVKGGLKIALGIGLIATVATGDVPGGAAGALLIAGAGIGAASTGVSGTMDIVGAATGTDVSKAQDALDATSNLPGLAVTAATGNLNAGKAAATISDVATLAASPREAMRNVATAAGAGRTAVSAGQLVHKYWNSLVNAASKGP